MKLKIGTILFGTAVLLTTCTKDVNAPSACFQEKILPIFVSNCAQSGCHNTKDHRGHYDFSNYEGIMKGVTPKHPLQSEVYKVIRGNNPSMPAEPYSRLTSTQVNLIKLWINAGAQNTSNCSGCDTTNYNYSSRISGIMTNWCVGCHNSSNKGGNYDLSNYEGVSVAVKSGRLLGSIQHQQGYMAMPQNGGMMDDCEIKAIEKWINAGYPNN